MNYLNLLLIVELWLRNVPGNSQMEIPCDLGVNGSEGIQHWAQYNLDFFEEKTYYACSNFTPRFSACHR